MKPIFTIAMGKNHAMRREKTENATEKKSEEFCQC
jgi:hypothetical protein